MSMVRRLARFRVAVVAAAAIAMGAITSVAPAASAAPAPVASGLRIGEAAPAQTVLYYQFVNYNSDKCLDVTGRSTANGARIQQWDCDVSGNGSGANQGWGFVPAATSGYYTAVNLNSGKCLDVTGRSTANGAVLQQWTCNGGTNQEWFPRVVQNNPAATIYNLVNLNSGKCLDVTGRSTANGAVVQQWTCNGGVWFAVTGM